MTRRAIYPGSFDPVTLGHEDIIHRSLHLVDEVLVAVAVNPAKEPLLTLAERVELLRQVMDGEPRVRIVSFEGLLARYASEHQAPLIIRGLRAVSDFEYEFQLANMNRALTEDVETVFLTPTDKYTYISSTLVREVASLGGDVSEFVSPKVKRALDRATGK